MLCKTVPRRQIHLAQWEAELHSDGFPAAFNQSAFFPLWLHKQAARCCRRERAALSEESRSLFSFQMNFMRFR